MTRAVLPWRRADGFGCAVAVDDDMPITAIDSRRALNPELRTGAEADDRAVAPSDHLRELVTGSLRDGDFFSHLRVTQHGE